MNKSDSIEPEPLTNEAIDILRVWLVKEGGQEFSTRCDVWNDPAAWGILFVDLARHLSRVYSNLNGQTFEQNLQCILEGMQAEFSDPTD